MTDYGNLRRLIEDIATEISLEWEDRMIGRDHGRDYAMRRWERWLSLRDRLAALDREAGEVLNG